MASRSDVPWPNCGSDVPLFSSDQGGDDERRVRLVGTDVHGPVGESRETRSALVSLQAIVLGDRRDAGFDAGLMSHQCDGSSWPAIVPEGKQAGAAHSDLVARLAVDRTPCAAGADEVD